MAERSLLDLIIRSRKTGTGARDASGELRKFRGEADKASRAAKALNLGLKAAQGAAIAAGLQFIRSVPALVDLGLESERTEVALRAMVGGALAAEQALEGVQRGAGGALDRLTAMQNATRLASMGLASNAEEMEQLTDIAITLGATMGRGPQAAFEEFTLLLANQSILRLDTFGISAGRVRERMNELAEIMPEADRQTRFLTATMEEAQGKMMALDAAGFEATSSVDRFKAALGDAKLEVAEFLANGLLPWFDLLFKGRDALIEHEQNVRLTADSYADYVQEIQRANDASGPFIKNIDIVSEGVFKSSRAVAEGVTAIDGWAASLLAANKVTDETAASTEQMAVSLSKLTQAEIGREAIKNLDRAYEEGWLTQQEYEAALLDVGTSMLELSEAQIQGSLALQRLGQDFDEGRLGVADYVDELFQLNERLNDIPAEITTRIRIITEGSVPELPGYQFGGQFTVRGLPGPDRNIVAFRASNREVITVTPPAATPPTAAGLQIGQISISVGQGANGRQIVDEMMAEISRRVSIASASGAAFVGG